tara:strand:- start:1105 stop:1650 length:546 start_codon:yes stop_codon:yes gene_type:complete
MEAIQEKKAVQEPIPVAIGLGGNIGDAETCVLSAIARLGSEPWLSNVCASSLYKTEPWGEPNQPEFINAVITGITDWRAEQILERLHAIESEYGRVRYTRYGPRTLDLDLILLGDQCIESERASVPHPEYRQRAFVLAPLVEIAPEWLDPITGLRIEQLWANLGDPGTATRIDGQVTVCAG